MLTAQWIIEQFEEWSPREYAEEWDNVGLLIGDASQPVKKILVALAATESVINEAIAGGFDFIICHHPPVYNPVKRITTDDSTGRRIIALIKNGIGCYCAHTNLDKAVGGVNDCLAGKIGLQNLSPLVAESGLEIPSSSAGTIMEASTTEGTITEASTEAGMDLNSAELCRAATGIGRVGFLPKKMKFVEFYEGLKNSLGIESIRYCGDAEKIVEKIGVCGGDGSNPRYINAAIAHGCDVYVTGDLRYHCAQDALESGITLVDITHYGGEVFILNEIVSRLRNAAKNSLEIFPSSIDGQVFKCM
jgi:dinuclear metal center YbgI/SA1388 family protein